jgi:muramoyltetrapeptide carboxypeptidase LdcA involved in peptidoglycan recycling
MIPPKLKKGDEVRVIAPANSMSIISEETQKTARECLESMELHVTFGKHIEESDEFASSSVKSRLTDLHDAFKDPKVKAVFPVIGGYNSNQLLAGIDYELIRRNPKILIGYSDITALQNAIYAQTGLLTYSGPCFSTLGMKRGNEFTLDYLKKCVFDNKPFSILPSESWSDDNWYLDQEKRAFIPNEGYNVITPGTAEGTIIGGNMCTFQLLHGTKYMPSLKDAILFLEEDEESGANTALMFDRDMQSLIHQPGFSGVRGIVIGRFQKASEVTQEKITAIIRSKPELTKIPVIYGADFGHTSPLFTFPIGGMVRIDAKNNKVTIEILAH